LVYFFSEGGVEGDKTILSCIFYQRSNHSIGVRL
jgi:hypothetical protein